VTKTNTNTNINQTISKDNSSRRKRGSGASVSSADVPVERRSSKENSDDAGPCDRHAAGAESDTSQRDRAVSFSGESGGESSEDFRSLRRQHYSNQWKQDRAVPAAVSSLETNTNTNLNAGSGAAVSSRTSSNHSVGNPSEAGRPPVSFGAEIGGGYAGGPSTSSAGYPTVGGASKEFRGRRQKHYDEVAAVRKFKECRRTDGPTADEEDEEDDDDSEGLENVLEGAASSTSGRPVLSSGGVQAFAHNPSEPRYSAGVAFKDDAAVAGPAAEGGSVGSASTSGSSGDWRSKRAAHYNEMAAALRARPPPSSDEEDDDGE
jgi:hypothetical protein